MKTLGLPISGLFYSGISLMVVKSSQGEMACPSGHLALYLPGYLKLLVATWNAWATKDGMTVTHVTLADSRQMRQSPGVFN